MDFTLKAMDFALKTMDFTLKTMDFTLKTMDFTLKTMDFALKTMDFTLKTMDFTLKTMDFDLNRQVGVQDSINTGATKTPVELSAIMLTIESMEPGESIALRLRAKAASEDVPMEEMVLQNDEFCVKHDELYRYIPRPQRKRIRQFSMEES